MTLMTHDTHDHLYNHLNKKIMKKVGKIFGELLKISYLCSVEIKMVIRRLGQPERFFRCTKFYGLPSAQKFHPESDSES